MIRRSGGFTLIEMIMVIVIGGVIAGMVALSIKAVFLTLALLGLATLWMAIAADMGASLLVIFNGLRLLDVRTE